MAVIARLVVPQRHAPLFSKLGTLTDDEFSRLGEGIEELSSRTSYRAATKRVRSLFSSGELDGEDLLSALLTLHALHASHGWPLSDIAETVSQSAAIDIAPDKRGSLAERVGVLLRFEALRNLAKATELAAEREHLFHTARIITDVRPVFTDNAEDVPPASIVIQTLRIEYFDTNDGRPRVFEASLADEDVRTLQAACERAIAKGTTVRAVVESAGMPEIETAAE